VERCIFSPFHRPTIYTQIDGITTFDIFLYKKWETIFIAFPFFLFVFILAALQPPSFSGAILYCLDPGYDANGIDRIHTCSS
ncbi:hypothetical protein LI224_18780, partial [Erysipelatoclostridium ramosum]|nr:hypothetical protein [Thomasclavelia ramosa]